MPRSRNGGKADLRTCWTRIRAQKLSCAPWCKIQAALPAGVVSAAGHAVAAGRDVNIRADRGGVAAGVIHGNVAPPALPARARQARRARVRALDRGSGSVIADRGGTAIGQVMQQHRPGITGKPVRLADPPLLLPGATTCSQSWISGCPAVIGVGRGRWPWRIGRYGEDIVALAYAQRRLAEVGVAWQLAAEDPTVLAAGFGELAAQLGARDVLDTRDPVASVHGALAAFRPSGCWCLTMRRTGHR